MAGMARGIAAGIAGGGAERGLGPEKSWCRGANIRHRPHDDGRSAGYISAEARVVLDTGALLDLHHPRIHLRRDDFGISPVVRSGSCSAGAGEGLKAPPS